MTRPDVTDENQLAAVEILIRALGQRIEEHGRGAHASVHESMGLITEEYHEFVEAVKSNDLVAIANEAIDIAVGCVFMVASHLQTEQNILAAREQLQSQIDAIVT